MKDSEPAKMLRQPTQNCTAVVEHADCAVRKISAAPESNGDKSLIAGCFTAFDPQMNVQANPRDFSAPSKPRSSRSGMNSASPKGTVHSADGLLWTVDNFCKTGIRSGIQGRFGKWLPEVGPRISPNLSGFLFRAQLSGQRQKAKPGTRFVFRQIGVLSATNPPCQSHHSTHAAADARRGERRNEE